MQGDRARHPVHGEISSHVSGFFPSSFHRPALERDLRKLGHIEKISAPQVVVAFLNAGIDARAIDFRDHVRPLWMITVEIDRSGEAMELPPRCAQHMMNFKPDLRSVLIEGINLSGV